MTFAGLALASRVTRRSGYELLAQVVDGVLPMFRDANGGFYFDRADLADLPRRVICGVKGCGRPCHLVALCLCSTHEARYRKGADLTARIRTDLVTRGPRKREARRERSGATMRLVARPEQTEALSVIWESGGTVQSSKWASEDRQAEQLGTPEMWQKVADQALERAWRDLMDGSYRERLSASLRSRRPRTLQVQRQATEASQRVVQPPLVASVKGGLKNQPARHSYREAS